MNKQKLVTAELEQLNIQKRFRNKNEVLRYLANLTKLFDTAEKSLKNILDNMSPVSLQVASIHDFSFSFGDDDEGGDNKPKLNKNINVKPADVKLDKGTLKTIQEYYSVLSTYSNALRILEAQIEQWRSNPEFSDVFKTILTESQKCKTKLEKAIQASQKTLNLLANKQLPPAFAKIIGGLAQELQEKLKSRFDKCNTTTLLTVSSVKPLVLVFTHYYQFVNLKDSNGDIEPEYYIVLSFTLDDEGNNSMHVTTMRTKELPGTFDTGEQVSSLDKALISIDNQMTADAFDFALFNTELPITQEDVKKQFKNDLKMVTDIEVTHENIIYFFEKKLSEKDIQSIIVHAGNLLSTVGAGRIRRHEATSCRFVLSVGKKGKPTLKDLGAVGYGYRVDDNAIQFIAIDVNKNSMPQHKKQIRTALDSMGYTEKEGYLLQENKTQPVLVFSIKPPATNRDRAVTNRDFIDMLKKQFNFDKNMLNKWRNLVRSNVI